MGLKQNSSDFVNKSGGWRKNNNNKKKQTNKKTLKEAEQWQGGVISQRGKKVIFVVREVREEG